MIPSNKEIDRIKVSNTEPTNREKIWLRNGEKNLFDPVLSTKEYYINNQGTKVANENWTITDFIKVTPNGTYTYQGLTNVGNEPSSIYCDMDKKQVSIFKQEVGTKTITIPSNVYYVRFSINEGSGDVDTFMIEEGSTASNYEPYKGIYILNENNEYEKFM